MTVDEVAEITDALPVGGVPMFVLMLHVAGIGKVEMRHAAGGADALSKGFDRGLELYRTDTEFRAAYKEGAHRIKTLKQYHGIA